MEITLLESYLVLLLWIAGISGVCAIAALIADLISVMARNRQQMQIDEDVARIIARMDARRENNKPKLRIVK